MNDVRERLISCLNRNGIDLFDETQNVDSLSFITAIVDIECEFEIEFTDEFLTFESMSSFDKLYEIVLMLISEKKDE